MFLENPQKLSELHYSCDFAMARVTLSTTTKGNPCLMDVANYMYYKNNGSKTDIDYWKCSVKACNARIRTKKGTLEVVGELPGHIHESNVLKRR